MNPPHLTKKVKRVSIFTSILVLITLLVGKKTYDLASAPKEKKNCDFAYPGAAGEARNVISFFPLEDVSFDVAQIGGSTNDASCLNKTNVYGIATIKTESDIAEALAFAREHGLKITPAGVQHSMGGQSFSRGGLVLDMREFNEIKVDAQKKVITVQSGAIWKEVQAELDKIGLAVKAMQSINLFSVGGTLSVNAHGVAHDPGQIAPTVRSMRIMLSSGEIKTAGPTENSELFSAVLGGYGLVGIILDVQLDIVDNDFYAWKVDYIDYHDFREFYEQKIVGNNDVALAYARLSISPTSYLTEIAVNRYETIDFTPEPQPLGPPSKVWLKRLIFNFSKTGGFGRWVRWIAEKNIEPGVHTCVSRNQIMTGSTEEICVASRNQKMNQSMDYLNNKQQDTNILQEYFIPLENITVFIDGLKDIVTNNDVNLLNVTLRIVTKDTITALPYAKDDRIAFVLYFNQRLNMSDSKKLEQVTPKLIDLAIENGGTYYLPYQLYYSRQQLQAAYPEIDDFFGLKRKHDPIGLFSNTFYEKYGG